MRREFISDKLVNMIEKNAEELSKNWLRDVKKCDRTPTYKAYNEQKLYDRVFRVYSQLGKWISRETTREEIAKHYIDLGQERKKEGFALSEVIEALIITRRHVWLKVLSEGLLDTALDLLQALELNNRVVLFFDRAIFYITIGYEDGKYIPDCEGK